MRERDDDDYDDDDDDDGDNDDDTLLLTDKDLSTERLVYKYVLWWLIPRRRGLLGRLMVSSGILAGGCRDQFLMRTPFRALDRSRFGMRMVGILLALSASCVFPLRLHASLPRTYMAFLTDERQLSRSEASCCHDGWLIPACASCLFSWSLEHFLAAHFLAAPRSCFSS